MNDDEDMACLKCGYAEVLGNADSCPLCAGGWETWDMLWPALPLPRNRDQVAAWLSHLPHPVAIDINARGALGVRIRLHAPPGLVTGAVTAWASMTHQQSSFVKSETRSVLSGQVRLLHSSSILPNVLITETNSDPILALGGQLISGLPNGEERGLRIWLIGFDSGLQEKIRELVSYSYGSSSGISFEAPNPWAMQLFAYRLLALLGIAITATCAGLALSTTVSSLYGGVGTLAGMLTFFSGALGMRTWVQWRSIPREILEARIKDTLIKTTIIAYGYPGRDLSLFSGMNSWGSTYSEWPGVKSLGYALPSQELAALIAPPELGEGGGILARDSVQDVPSAHPSRSLIHREGTQSIVVGTSVRTSENIGIDPDGHVLVAGGTRSGKSSFTYDVLKQLILQGDDAPGIFLVDPHLSLSDAFLQEIWNLPNAQRKRAIQRLRIISSDQPEVVPLNLLTLPEYSWAGNAIIQVGRRIWDDYWGPRMQAALLGLFRLAHIWNQQPDRSEKMGLIHVVFSAFNIEWRHAAMALLPPIDRLGSLGLDALLGQFSGSNGKWDQRWVTEVISPVLSKVLALELSPWLFSALHQKTFAPLDQWIKDKDWIVLRLPSGEMGREAARLTAGIIYNVFDAVFRKVALKAPIPFCFMIDEAQEIATGMRLEAMLSEGAKFGARMFVLTQSLTMMRHIEGFGPVVQALLANTSTQAFFSADPEDAEVIRATLNTTARFGITTLDLPTLQCWLRTRIGGRWQPPALIKVNPLIKPSPEAIQAIIREVIAAHPEDYLLPQDWALDAVHALEEMIPEPQKELLDIALASKIALKQGGKSSLGKVREARREAKTNSENGSKSDPRRLGF